VYVDAVQIENYARDGVNYEIVARKNCDGYLATWKCLDCAANGETSHGYVSAEAAMGGAKALLFSKHHVSAHLAAKMGIRPR
jgi:hypothetical protein